MWFHKTPLRSPGRTRTSRRRWPSTCRGRSNTPGHMAHRQRLWSAARPSTPPPRTTRPGTRAHTRRSRRRRPSRRRGRHNIRSCTRRCCRCSPRRGSARPCTGPGSLRSMRPQRPRQQPDRNQRSARCRAPSCRCKSRPSHCCRLDCHRLHRGGQSTNLLQTLRGHGIEARHRHRRHRHHRTLLIATQTLLHRSHRSML